MSSSNIVLLKHRIKQTLLILLLLQKNKEKKIFSNYESLLAYLKCIFITFLVNFLFTRLVIT